MNPKQLIELILSANSYMSVFPNLNDWNTRYKDILKQIHTDVCHEPNANEAVAKLNEYKDAISVGTKYKDDSGAAVYKPCEIIYTGDATLLKRSYDNYTKLMRFNDDRSNHFKRYMPKSGEITPDGHLKFTFFERAIPLSQIENHFNGEVPQKHVNWILSRLLEYCMWLESVDYAHCGFNPDSIFIIPENHGFIVTSFYHVTPIGNRLNSVSAKYSNFYPDYIFGKDVNKKKAASAIDLELATRIAVWLLGDKSGIGIKLRKTHNNELLNFYSGVHTGANETFFNYRELLKKLFKSEFHILDV